MLSVVSLCLHLFVGGGGARCCCWRDDGAGKFRHRTHISENCIYVVSTPRELCVLGASGETGSRRAYYLSLRPHSNYTASFPLFPPGRQWCEEGHQKTQSTARIGVNQKKSISTLPSLIELVDDCWYTHTPLRAFWLGFTLLCLVSKKKNQIKRANENTSFPSYY